MENSKNYIQLVGEILAGDIQAPAPKIQSPEVSVTEPVEEPDYIIRATNKVGALPKGALIGIKAKSKNGKSFVCCIFISSVLGDDLDEEPNEWGVTSTLADPTVVYFDTEQNRADTITIKRRVHSMLGWPIDKDYPHFTAHSLRTFTPEERLSYITSNITTTRPDLVVIDGVADLLMDFNDIEESNRLIGELMKLSTLNDCAIICVLHENKKADDHGMKGHLGTMLLQKSDEVYQVQKVGDKFNVTTTDCRHLPLPDFSFVVNPEGLPVPVQSVAQDLQMQKALEKELKVRQILKDCFSYKPEQTYTELVAAYMLHGAVAQPTAKKAVAWSKEHGLISIFLNKYRYAE